jgi:hypothetical protein
MLPTNPTEWWTAFGAIAQAAGALATFAAVALSLWIVMSERAMRAHGSAGIWVSFAGDGTPGVYMVVIRVQNAGVRPFQVNSIGWKTGWLRWGPQPLGYRLAIQNTSLLAGISRPPKNVEPGLSEGFYVTVADMKAEAGKASREELFVRKVPILGYCPIRAMIHISGRKPLSVKVGKDLANFLRTGEHASTTAEGE